MDVAGRLFVAKRREVELLRAPWGLEGKVSKVGRGRQEQGDRVGASRNRSRSRGAPLLPRKSDCIRRLPYE